MRQIIMTRKATILCNFLNLVVFFILFQQLKIFLPRHQNMKYCLNLEAETYSVARMTCATRMKTFVAYRQGVRELINEIKARDSGKGGTLQNLWCAVQINSPITDVNRPLKFISISRPSSIIPYPIL